MVWSASRVRRRLGIPREEELLVWARAAADGFQVPGAPMVPCRRWPMQVVLTERALWVSRAGAARRFALEDVVMASLIDRPDGALRVDFLWGDPLVVLVVDGGSLYHRLVRELRAIDQQLRREAPPALGFPDLPRVMPVRVEGTRTHPSRVSRPDGDDLLVGPGSGRPPTEASDLLHEAQVIVLRELRLALTGS